MTKNMTFEFTAVGYCDDKRVLNLFKPHFNITARLYRASHSSKSTDTCGITGAL
mgnify:FL=1